MESAGKVVGLVLLILVVLVLGMRWGAAAALNQQGAPVPAGYQQPVAAGSASGSGGAAPVSLPQNPPPAAPQGGVAQSPQQVAQSSGAGCQYMKRLTDLTGGTATLPAGWLILNAWKDGVQEHKVLIGPGDSHTVSGWKGSVWWLPGDCGESAQTNYQGNPLPAGTL